MNVIWKWTLTPGSTDLHMPADSKVLAVQMQGGQPQLWALVDDHNPKVWRTFDVYGTGHAVPGNHGAYVGTFQMDSGALVWHVFESTRQG